MKRFIYTAESAFILYYTDLKAVEIDTGYTVVINLYLRGELFDFIDVQVHCKGSKIHKTVKGLPVSNEDGKSLGTIGDRLKRMKQYLA